MQKLHRLEEELDRWVAFTQTGSQWRSDRFTQQKWVTRFKRFRFHTCSLKWRMFDSPYCTTTVSLCIYKRLFQWYISTSVLYLISALGIVCMSLCWCYHCISHRYELELHFTIRNVLQHSFPWRKCIPFISSYSENSTECKRHNLWLYFPFFLQLQRAEREFEQQPELSGEIPGRPGE